MSQIGVVGASARAAVHSLIRAGQSCWAIDLFNDRDLIQYAGCVRCPADRYPESFAALAKEFPPGPFLYTGGLENHPSIIRSLASERELWGNPSEVVACVRDQFALLPTLAEAGFSVPRLAARELPCPDEGSWLRKPYRSAGGSGIRFAEAREPPSSQHYFQEFIPGIPMSAVFVNDRIFGITEQLIGLSALHAQPFAYCGNILTNSPGLAVPAAGAFLAQHAQLRGVWGLDFIQTQDAAYIIEVNPRYTASVEVIELHSRTAAFSFAATGARLNFESGTLGKAIYYAPQTIIFPDSGPWDSDLAGDFDPWRLPHYADIPSAGSVIEPGSPLLTLFTAGSTPLEVRERLQSSAAQLDSFLLKVQP